MLLGPQPRCGHHCIVIGGVLIGARESVCDGADTSTTGCVGGSSGCLNNSDGSSRRHPLASPHPSHGRAKMRNCRRGTVGSKALVSRRDGHLVRSNSATTRLAACTTASAASRK